MQPKVTQIVAFKAFLLTVIFLISAELINLKEYYLLSAAILAIVSIVFVINKFKIASYLTSLLSISLLLSLNIDSTEIITAWKIIPEQKAIIVGNVEKVIKRNASSTRLLIFGTVDSKHLKPQKKQKIILTVYHKRHNLPEVSPGTQISAKVKIRLPHKKQIEEDFPESNYAKSLGIRWFARASSSDFALISKAKGLMNTVHIAVKAVQDRIDRLFSANTAPIVKALITGDKSHIPYETKYKYSVAGTAHLLAVSGLHIGIIAAAIFFLLGYINNRLIKFILFTVLLTAFVMLSGIQPSAVRAAVMSILFMLLWVLDRKANFLNIIGAAGLFFIAIQPAAIYSAAFQMSFLAITGIALFYDKIRTVLTKLLLKENSFTSFISVSVALTLSSSIIVSPLVAYYFNVFSVFSVFANIIAVPLMTGALIFSMIALIISFLHIGLAEIYASAADFLINLNSRLNDIINDLPFSHLSDTFGLVFAVLASIILLYLIFSDNKRQLLFRLSASIAVLILAGFMTIDADRADNNILLMPRNQFFAAEIPLSDNKCFYLIADREPDVYPIRDYSVEQRIKSCNKKIILGVSGNAGLLLAENLRQFKDFEQIELSLEDQSRIRHLLGLNREFAQIIEIQ